MQLLGKILYSYIKNHKSIYQFSNLKLNNKGAPRDGIVQLYDLYGKLLFVKEIRFSAGNSTCVVNLPGSISYGVYFLNIFAGEDEVLRQKLIIATHSE